MHVDIVIDTICPWCYVGKERFRRALEQSPQKELRVGWRPFRIARDLSGDAGRRRAAFEALEKVGKSEGIAFDFRKMKRVPDTLDSHRLVRYAAGFDLQAPLVDALFEGYFTAGEDIGDRETLVRIAGRAGLEAAAVRAFLASGEERDKVVAEDELARRLGINGVPSFIVNRKYAISGAQAPEVFAKIFELANRDEASGREAAVSRPQ